MGLKFGEISRNLLEVRALPRRGGEHDQVSRAPDSRRTDSSFRPRVSLDRTLRPLPSCSQAALELRSRISGEMAVGRLIEGVVAADATRRARWRS
jgi:hypothetical protein